MKELTRSVEVKNPDTGAWEPLEDYQTKYDKALQEEIDAEFSQHFEFGDEDEMYPIDSADKSYPSNGLSEHKGDPWTKPTTGVVSPVSSTTNYGSQYGTPYKGVSYIYKPHVDHKETFITIKGSKVGGFAKKDLVDFDGLLVNCSGTPILDKKSIVTVSNPKLKFLMDSKYVIKTRFEELSIDWYDRSDVDLTPEFWVDLTKYAFAEAKYPRVNVCCFGGHGRTGTAIACIMLAASHLDFPINGNKGMIKGPGKLMKWIRKSYCEDAIEGANQEDYIDYIYQCLK
jgi:hypothetical protein